MSIRIAAGLDPGVSTGLVLVRYPALWRYHPDSVTIVHTEVVTEYGHITEFLDLAASQADQYSSRLTVVMEDFVGSGPRNTEIVRSIKMCGHIEGTCEVQGFELVTQTSVQFKPFVREATALLENSKQEFSPHKVSALAHILCCLERRHR